MTTEATPAAVITLEALASFGASILARRDARLTKDIGNRPKYNTWASSISECSRQMVYSITHWDQKKLHDARLQARFNEGHKQEDKFKAELREILQDLGSDLVEDQAYLPKAMTDKYRVTGRIDSKFVFIGRRLPLEIKSMHPNVYERINTLQEMLEDPFQKRNVNQLMMYLFGHDEEFGMFALTDCLGHWKFVACQLDYAYTESLLKRVEEVNRNVDAKTLPARIPYNSKLCGFCDFAHICLPDVINEARTVFVDDKAMEDALNRRSELDPLRKEYADLDENLKEAFKAKNVPLAVVGDWTLTRKETKKGIRVEIEKMTPSNVNTI